MFSYVFFSLFSNAGCGGGGGGGDIAILPLQSSLLVQLLWLFCCSYYLFWLLLLFGICLGCSVLVVRIVPVRVLDLSHPFGHEVTPLQGTTRKIKSPHEIKKSPHNWQITKAQRAQKFNRTLWYRSRISSCLCIMPNIRSQNQHLLINRPLAQQVRQSNPLKLLSYLSVLIQKGLHTLA